MSKLIIKWVDDTLATLSCVFRHIMELKSFTIIVLFGALIYYSANHAIIGISQDTVLVYGLMTSAAFILALVLKVDLDQLGWRADAPYSGKKVSTPTRIHWIVITAVIIAIITGVLTVIFTRGPQPIAINGQAALDMAFQQLFIITLAETVVFQGVIPLIIKSVLFSDPKTGKSELTEDMRLPWAVIYMLAGVIFAVMHKWVYGGDLADMFIVGFLGVCWLWLARRVSMTAAWFSHFGYNCVRIGIVGGAAAQMFGAI